MAGFPVLVLGAALDAPPTALRISFSKASFIFPSSFPATSLNAPGATEAYIRSCFTPPVLSEIGMRMANSRAPVLLVSEG